MNAGLILTIVASLLLPFANLFPSCTSVFAQFSISPTDGGHDLLLGVFDASLDRGGARTLAALRGTRFAASFHDKPPPGLIDLAAILLLLLAPLAAPEFKTLLLLRLVRFLKLTRYSPAMSSLLEALYAERRALIGCFVILLGTALIAAGLMHLSESTVQPDKFGTIPHALWWAIVTLGTVGYGDAVPVTTIGRLIADYTIFAGLPHGCMVHWHSCNRICKAILGVLTCLAMIGSALML